MFFGLGGVRSLGLVFGKEPKPGVRQSAAGLSCANTLWAPNTVRFTSNTCPSPLHAFFFLRAGAGDFWAGLRETEAFCRRDHDSNGYGPKLSARGPQVLVPGSIYKGFTLA